MSSRIPELKASGEHLKKSPKTGNDVFDIASMAKAVGEEWHSLGASEKQVSRSLSNRSGAMVPFKSRLLKS